MKVPERVVETEGLMDNTKTSKKQFSIKNLKSLAISQDAIQPDAIHSRRNSSTSGTSKHVKSDEANEDKRSLKLPLTPQGTFLFHS